MRKLIVDERIRHKIANLQIEHDFRKETGGILVGSYDPDESALRITDMSQAYPTDRCGRFHFSRNSSGHQKFMDDLWISSGKTKAYLGEWHTHNQAVPAPSLTDKNTWKRISRKRNNFDQCYFLIIGREQFVVWTVTEGTIKEVEECC